MNNSYTPSRMLAGDAETIRQHSFTRWMSRDLMQATTDFCKNIGLIALYAECSPDNLFRYLFWHTPRETLIEVRSGRPRGKFEEFDRKNQDRDMPLLSLHINERDIYSAVWISSAHYDIAKKMLMTYGITPAERKVAG